MIKILSNVTNHNSYNSCCADISIWRDHKALAERSSVLVSSFLATDDEMAEKARESPRKAAQLSGGVSLTWQGT